MLCLATWNGHLFMFCPIECTREILVRLDWVRVGWCTLNLCNSLNISNSSQNIVQYTSRWEFNMDLLSTQDNGIYIIPSENPLTICKFHTQVSAVCLALKSTMNILVSFFSKIILMHNIYLWGYFRAIRRKTLSISSASFYKLQFVMLSCHWNTYFLASWLNTFFSIL